MTQLEQVNGSENDPDAGWLRSELDRITGEWIKAKDEANKLHSKLEQAVSTLEFYGDNESRANLYGKFISQYNSDCENYRILDDKGERARQTLEELKGDEK
jgi:hypothetical protein